MPALPDLLSEAASRDAFEVVMETGQPVIMNTAKGGVPLGEALSEDDLFAALTAVLSEEQQVELMVGNVVEFDVSARGDWRVLTEPGRDGIAIRARRSGHGAKAEPKGPSIDLPPVAPFVGAGIDLPPLAEDSFSHMAVQRPTPRDLPAIESEAGVSISAGADGLGFFDDASSVDLFDDGLLDLDGVPEPAPEEDSDFMRVDPPSAPRSVAPAASPVRAVPEPRPVRPRGHDSATRIGLAPPPGSPVADTRSDLGTVIDDTPPVSGPLAEVARHLPHPGVTFVHEIDVDELAALVERETVLVEDGSDPPDVCATLHALPPGSVVVMRVEDTSRWLGFILRRLEEGYSFLIETRAQTPGGAKRCLLGPSATVRAESWLGRHALRSLVGADGVWTLVLPI